MDLGPVLGTVAVIVVFLFGVLTPEIKTENLQFMWDAPSLIIVIMGTVAATLMSYPLDLFMGIGKSIK